MTRPNVDLTLEDDGRIAANFAKLPNLRYIMPRR